MVTSLGFFKKINKRYNFTSKFNVRLYKKCLSLKLVLKNNQIKVPNLGKHQPIKIIRKIYARKELIALRLLRFFFLLDYAYLKNLGYKLLVSKKLSVYSGNKSKFININKDC